MNSTTGPELATTQINLVAGGDMPMLQAFESYLVYNFGLAKRTKQQYRLYVTGLATWLGNPPLQDVDGLEVAKYFGQLVQKSGQPYSPSYLSQCYRSINTFFNFCLKIEWLERNPMRFVRKPKVPRRIPPRLSLTQIQQAIEALNSTQEGRWHTRRRNLALFLVMVDSGLRRNEVVNLKRADVDLEARELNVYSDKTQKSRIVPISKTTRRAIEAYLAERADDHPALFLGQQGQPLNADMVNSVVKRLKKRLGVDNLHPHLLRHTFARHYINRGELKKLQQILGHSDIRTTADYYAEASIEAVKAEFELSSPVAQLGGDV